MKVQHDALNASCPNEEFCITVPNDEQDRGLANVERVGYPFQLQEEMDFKEHKAELEQSKNSILKLKLVQHLQHSMKWKLFIVKVRADTYIQHRA